MIIKEININVTEGTMSASRSRKGRTQRTPYADIDSLELCPFTLENVHQCVMRGQSDLNRTCPFTLETSFQMNRIHFRNTKGFLYA
jgi:hypothetical protein